MNLYPNLCFNEVCYIGVALHMHSDHICQPKCRISILPYMSYIGIKFHQELVFTGVGHGDYIPNTIILYFIVHCIYVLRIFYCITCLCLSLTPPVSGLRCIVFNKVLFCSVLRCSKPEGSGF